jgi:hypothetical protein
MIKQALDETHLLNTFFSRMLQVNPSSSVSAIVAAVNGFFQETFRVPRATLFFAAARASVYTYWPHRFELHAGIPVASTWTRTRIQGNRDHFAFDPAFETATGTKANEVLCLPLDFDPNGGGCLEIDISTLQKPIPETSMTKCTDALSQWLPLACAQEATWQQMRSER